MSPGGKGRIAVGISSCLVGLKVRHDGSHKEDRFITGTLGRYFRWVPVCPEVEYGLPVPREAMRLVGDPSAPRLLSSRTRADHTGGMLRWAGRRLEELEAEDLSGFIFKSRSPSSGLRGVRVHTPAGTPGARGFGLFGRAFTERFPLIPAEDDGRLHNPALRENFIERVFMYRRLMDFARSPWRLGDLVALHTEMKLLVLAHSPAHYRELGRLVAEARKFRRADLIFRYLRLSMEGLSLLATAKKNANVLMHMAGYFKKLISPDEKAELLGVIEDYRRGLLPLAVPVALVRHYVRKFGEPYLSRQIYLNPHPAELMLRNHA
ncbi:MAG: DUF523 and DUF1722 domain-containing protein [Thermodesulfovibrionales bacterium]